MVASRRADILAQSHENLGAPDSSHQHAFFFKDPCAVNFKEMKLNDLILELNNKLSSQRGSPSSNITQQVEVYHF